LIPHQCFYCYGPTRGRNDDARHLEAGLPGKHDNYTESKLQQVVTLSALRDATVVNDGRLR
jgi:hypothetical protein